MEKTLPRRRRANAVTKRRWSRRNFVLFTCVGRHQRKEEEKESRGDGSQRIRDEAKQTKGKEEKKRKSRKRRGE